MKNIFLFFLVFCLASCSSSGKKEELKNTEPESKVSAKTFEYVGTPSFPLRENQQVKKLKGVVVQETKTRIGYDFYERFSFLWDGSGKDIIIKELANPLWGNLIWIEVDNNKVWQKAFGPRSREIEETVAEAISATKNYLNFIREGNSE
ncbi:curli production assembly/transport protein CsgE [Patescibacteria group bacterium]|nr:curli production assembly/transport protein CsgE [Patescibacteria group bacterium]